MSYIKFKNLTFSYSDTPILKDISFEIKKGEIAVFLGKSGSGKSTLLKLLSGLEHPQSGEISKEGNIISTPKVHLPANKRKTSVVFQDNTLFAHLTVEKNIKLARTGEDKDLFNSIIKDLEINELINKFPHELSGGQCQRVSIARAIYQETDLILFDEPFSALDTNLRLNIRRKIKSWLKRTNKTAIFITHDKEEAFYLADNIFILNNGKIVQSGTQEELTKLPKTSFVANFISKGVCLPKEIAKTLLDKSNNFKYYFIQEENIIFSEKKGSETIECIVLDRIQKNSELDTIYISPETLSKNTIGPFEVSKSTNEIIYLSVNDRTNFIGFME